ncbi:MAG: amino acid ABC transporter substrate-binding protein [Firmicutes bacterium]|nr:amino acid ABC transporter substrate-binding protein [Bacillota bacterium]
MKKSLLFFVIVALAFALLFTGCAPQGGDAGDGGQTADADDSWNIVEQRGYLQIGLDDTFAPMGFRDTANQIVGYDIDLGNAVGEKLGIEMRWIPCDWDGITLSLNNGDIDAIWNGLSITEERQQQIDFSAPYMDDDQIIVVAAASDIQTKADLAGKVLGLQLGSSSEDALDSDPDTKNSLADIKKYNSFAECLSDLANGRIDAVCVDSVYYYYFDATSQSDFEYRVLDENFGHEPLAIGFRKGDDALQAKIEEAFNELKADGTASEICVKWFGEDLVVK